MKFLLSFLFLAFVACQATAYSPVEIEIDLEHNDEYYIEQFISWSEIWTKIKDFMKKIKDALDVFTGDMKQVFDKIKEKIKEIAGVGSVSDITDKIIKALKKMLGSINAKVQACIDKQKPAIKTIAEEAEKGAAGCIIEAQGSLDGLETEAKNIKKQATAMLKDAAKDGAKCILSPSTASDCLSAVMNKLETQSKELWTLAKGVGTMAKQILKDVGNCANGVRKETQDKITKVYNEIVDCSTSKYYFMY